MEEIGDCTLAMGFVRDVFQLRGREVRKQNLASARGFAANVFREIPNRHVHRVRRFVAYHRELCLVRGDDQRDDGTPGLALVNLLL